MKKIMALVLAAVMLLCLAGCGVPEEILGSWERVGQFSPEQKQMVMEALEFSEKDIELLSSVEIGYMEGLQLKEDGTYTVILPEENVSAAMYGYAEDIFAYMYENRGELSPELADLPITEDQFMYIGATGLGYADFDALRSDWIDIGEALFEEDIVVESGTYSVMGKRITFKPDGGESYKVRYEMVEGFSYMNLWYDDYTVSLHLPDLRVKK